MMQQSGTYSRESRPLRIGAVSYLNTRPLIYSLESRLNEAELVLDLPSRLADGLVQEQLDVALIPSIDYLQRPQYRLVSDACIACRGPVLSVKLLARRPWRLVRTLALDEGSHTSAVLARILLRQRFGIDPDCMLLPETCSVRETRADAVLLIGDRAIDPGSLFGDEPLIDAWDLGEQWCHWSKLPFVFAVWAARPGLATERIDEALRAARDAGVSRLAEIATQAAPRVGLTTAACLAYLRDNLHFYLGPHEQQGLDLFARCARELDLVPI